jgi:hypothetical protein
MAKRHKPGRKVSPQWFRKHDVEPHILVLRTEGTAESVEPGRLVTKGAWASSSAWESYDSLNTVLMFEAKQDMMAVKLAHSDYVLNFRGLHMPDRFWRDVWPWNLYVVDIAIAGSQTPFRIHEKLAKAIATLDEGPKAGCFGIKYPWDDQTFPVYNVCFNHKDDADYFAQTSPDAVAQYEVDKWPN